MIKTILECDDVAPRGDVFLPVVDNLKPAGEKNGRMTVQALQDFILEGPDLGPPEAATLPLPADDSAYALAISTPDGRRGIAPSILTRESLRSDNFPLIDFSKKPYDVREGISDGRAAVQACIDEKLAQYGQAHFQPKFMIPVSGRIMLKDLGSWTGTQTSTVGLSMILGLNPITGVRDRPFDGGAILQLYPTTGRSDGRIKQTISHSRIGNSSDSVGRFGGSGQAITGSSVLTGVQLDARTRAMIDAGFRPIIEFDGSDDITVVLGWDNPGKTAVAISKPALINTGADAEIVVREAYTLTASSVAGSKEYTIIGASAPESINNLRLYMRAAGAGVGADEPEERPGFNQWATIDAIDLVNNKVTLDEVARATVASFQMTFWAEVHAVYRKPNSSAVGYDPQKDYPGLNISHVEARKVSGMGFLIRNCHQTHFFDSKGDATDRGAIYLVGSNDSWMVRSGGGNCWDTPVTNASSATPRFSGEAYLPRRRFGNYTLAIRNIREAASIDCDFNGPILLRGHPDEDKPIVTLGFSNQKWFRNNQGLDPTENKAYMTLINTHLALIGGGQKWSQALVSRPRFMFMGNNASVDISGQAFVMDPNDSRCPYGVETAPGSGVYEGAIADTGVKVFLNIIDPVSKQRRFTGNVLADYSDATTPNDCVLGTTGSTRGQGTAVALTTNVAAVVASITLGPGTYRLRAVAQFIAATSATGTRLAASMSLNTAMDTSDPRLHWVSKDSFAGVGNDLATGTMEYTELSIPVGTTRTFNLVVNSTFTGGAIGAYGHIAATRLR